MIHVRKQITRGRYITKHLLTLTPAGAESDLKRYGERRLARRKSPILTPQTTRFIIIIVIMIIIIIIIIIIINIIIKGSKSRGGDITPNIFLAHTTAGAELDLNAVAAAPIQTEVTDLNCSDHSTTSKEMAACLARPCRRSVQVRLCTSGCMSEKNVWCYISPA